MPELPEVETIRRDLVPVVVGKRIVEVEATGARTVRRRGAEELVARVEGRVITGLTRLGKYLQLGLDGGDVVVVHLGMSGQLLLVQAAAEARPRHTHVVLTLDDGCELRFVDPRTFGEVFVTGAGVPELAHVGIDALEGVRSAAHLGEVLRARRSMLKPLLMGQRSVAGLGNIYTDEVLFAAGVRHDRRSDTLSSVEVDRLHAAMTAILCRAIEHRGSSLSDLQYRDAGGRVGGFQSLLQVYDRAGQPCSRCGEPIARDKSAGRSTFHCPRCQV